MPRVKRGSGRPYDKVHRAAPTLGTIKSSPRIYPLTNLIRELKVIWEAVRQSI